MLKNTVDQLIQRNTELEERMIRLECLNNLKPTEPEPIVVEPIVPIIKSKKSKKDIHIVKIDFYLFSYL